MEHHMVMLGIMGLPVVEIADCGGVFCVGRVDRHAAAHAEMDHQHLAAVERAEQIFGAALERGDRAAFEAGDEIGREREAQIGAALFDVERDVEANGQPVGAFDIVLAANVLHATAEVNVMKETRHDA